jgi:hypothetical protein
MLVAAWSCVLALIVVFVLGAPVVLGERGLLGEQGEQVVLGDADGLEGLVADVRPVGWTVGKSPAAMTACPPALMIRRG